MDWLIIIGLVFFGISLIIIEIIFIPGTTVVGILGFLFGGYGVYLSFSQYGSGVGSAVLGISLVAGGLATFNALKSGAWNKFSLKQTNQAKFNDQIFSNLKVGQKGQTVSSLRPIGKAIFGELEIEVKSEGGFITEKTEIEISKVEKNKIIVTELKTT